MTPEELEAQKAALANLGIDPTKAAAATSGFEGHVIDADPNAEEPETANHQKVAPTQSSRSSNGHENKRSRPNGESQTAEA